MNTFTIKRNDTAPAYEATLEAPAGTPVDLTGATVRFIMATPDMATVKVNASATISDAAAGEVTYSWQAADTDTAGTYRAEWQVTFGSGAIRTFPSNGYLSVVVLADLA